MSFFGKLKDIVDVATLGGVTFVETQLTIGGAVVDVLVDLNNMVVKIGEDVFRAAPGEVFYPGLGPLAGLFKNEIEDELILLNPFGIVPSIDVFFGVDPVGAVVVVGDLTGKVQHRKMRADELRIARFVFRGTINKLDEITLTNLSGLDGNAFAAPAHAGGGSIHLAQHYRHDGRTEDIPLLMHELTHIWQIQQATLREAAVCRGLITAIRDEAGQEVYEFRPGGQWSDYGTEQQAGIIEAWTAGATRKDSGMDVGARNRLALASPLFRYVNGNVRRSAPNAKTGRGRSVRQLLVDGIHETLAQMLGSTPPKF